MDYEFEDEAYRYKCRQCRKVFCMPNCGICPSCKKRPEQENSICFECLEKAFDKLTIEEVADAGIKPGHFVAVGHDQVMHCCEDEEYHIWQRGDNDH